jgi:hypothetical protein
MNTSDSKTMFFFKAFLAGIIGSSALYYYWGNENTTIDLILINFHRYFGVVIIFWFWLGKKLSVKGWLRAGFIGSVIYSITIVLTTNLAEQLIGKPFESLWFVSRRTLNQAYLWIVVNGLGYGALRFFYWLSTYSYENDLLSFRQFIRSMTDVQWFNNLSHAIRYGLFGMILGFALYNFIQSKSVNDAI